MGSADSAVSFQDSLTLSLGPRSPDHEPRDNNILNISETFQGPGPYISSIGVILAVQLAFSPGSPRGFNLFGTQGLLYEYIEYSDT